MQGYYYSGGNCDVPKFKEAVMEEDWAWGLSLITLTIIIHAAGITFSAVLLIHIRDWVQKRPPLTAHQVLAMSISLIGVTGLVLAVLHGVEALLWAAAYCLVGAIATPQEAMLYSVDSITARGASGLRLESPWRMMGALEAVNGVLLFGMSTAFLFAVMQAYSPLVMAARTKRGMSRNG